MEPVEFLDEDDAPAAAPVEAAPRRSALLRLLVAAGGVLAIVLAALLARSTGGGDPAPAPTTAVALVPTRPAVPSLVPGLGDVARVVYLAGCTGCAHVPEVPERTLRAVLRAVPGADVYDAYTVISATTGRVFERGIRARVGDGTLQIVVSLATEGPLYTATRVDGPVRVAEAVHAGYHVTVRTRGVSVPTGRLLRLAAGSALIADR